METNKNVFVVVGKLYYPNAFGDGEESQYETIGAYADYDEAVSVARDIAKNRFNGDCQYYSNLSFREYTNNTNFEPHIKHTFMWGNEDETFNGYVEIHKFELGYINDNFLNV